MGCGGLTAYELDSFLNLTSCKNATFYLKEDKRCEFKTSEKHCVFTLKCDCSVSSDISKKYLIVTPEFVWINPNTPMAFDVESNVDWFIE